MKRLLLILPLIFVLAGCSESAQVNVDVFKENINKVFNEEIMTEGEIITQNLKNEDVSYWLPKGYNVCCSFFSKPDTGVITKYSVTSSKDNPAYKSFCKTFEKAVYKNNENIRVSTFEADNLEITVYEDTRYITADLTPTLKSEIIDENLNQ